METDSQATDPFYPRHSERLTLAKWVSALAVTLAIMAEFMSLPGAEGTVDDALGFGSGPRPLRESPFRAECGGRRIDGVLVGGIKICEDRTCTCRSGHPGRNLWQ